MYFFRARSGFVKTIRICEFLIAPRNNVQGEEIEHIKGFLHELKSKDFLLVENEGQDVYNEGFSSTPNRVARYFAKNNIDNINDLTKKTDEELKEIMRDSIENSYVPSSIFHKARQELEFRNIPKQDSEKDEIFRFSPEFHGIEVNLKSLWKKIKSWF